LQALLRPHPGLSQGDMRCTKEIEKERQKKEQRNRRSASTTYSHSANATKVGVGRNRGRSSPSSSASTLLSSSLPLHSQSFHSDTSLYVSPSVGAGESLPASVAYREFSNGRVHLLSAGRSRIVNRSFPLTTSFRTSGHRISCWALQRGRFFRTYSHVCVLYGHH